MAIQTLPGFTGLQYGRVSSMDGRAIGKLTDSNHLESFHNDAPQDYDKKIISIYTQTGLIANDFLDMINKSTPFYLDGLSDTWQWGIEKPFQFPKIIDIPDSTYSQSNVGLDGRTFEIVLDTVIAKNSIIAVGHKMYGQNWGITADAIPYGRGWIHQCTLITSNPSVEFVDPRLLLPGIDVDIIDVSIGEFDQDLGGLRKLADKITMFETLGSAYGLEHTITGWADDKRIVQKDGKPMDIMIYAQNRRNETPMTMNNIKWEPTIEYLMRKEMLELKVKRMIWSKPGVFKTNGSKQEIKKISAGVYYRMRNSGNYVPYNRGEFSANLLRSVFGDLFYRRVDMADRRVKMYTNEAGMDVFQQALKEDAFDSGLTFDAGFNDKFVQGQGQNLVYNFAFGSMVTRETGKIEVVHLKELDQPQTNLEFGQNKKSTPVFMVFDVSPTSDGTLVNNIREVRRANRPNMTWGYIDGRRHHLGAMASQGHSAANKFDGYTIFMDDRCDVFIEDMSRTVLIEEIPQF
jgi:hypothetical protein